MNQAALELLIKLKDEASAGIGNIGKTLGGLGAAALAGVAVAGTAIVGFGIEAVKAAAEAERGQAALNAVLTSTKGAAGVTVAAANDIASSLQKVTPFEDDVILGAENLLLTFTNIGKNVFPQATETVLNLATAMGGDTKGAALQLGKALNDPIAGIGALSRVGVTFTDQQKKQIKTMQEAGNMAGAQGIILKELETEFGGAAKAAGGTFAGQMEIAKNALGDVYEAVGAQLLPVITPLIGKFAEFATKLATDVGPILANIVSSVIDFVSAIASGGTPLGMLQKALEMAFGSDIAAVILDIVTGVKTFFEVLADGGDLGDFGDAISELATTDLGGVMADIAYKAKGVVTAIQNAWPQIKQTALDVFNAVSSVVTTVISTVMTVIGGVVKFVSDNWGTISAVAKTVFDAVILAVQTAIASAIIIINGIVTTWQQVSAIIGPIITAIGTTLTNVFAAFSAFWTANSAEIIGTFTAIWTQISTIITTIQGIITIAWTAIAGNVGANNTSMLTSVTTVFNSIVTFLGGVVGFITAHGEQIKLVFSLIWTAVKTIIDLALTLIGGLLTAALQLMQGNTAGAMETLKDTFSKAWELIKTLVITALNLIKTELLLILDAMLAGAGTSLENLKTAFVNGINGVLDRAKGFYNDFLALGTGLITKIADGIRAAPEAVWNALKDIIMSQLNNLGSFLGIKLPFGGSGGRGANSFTGSRAASGFSESGTSGFAFGGRGASVTINISANVSGGADIDALARAVAKRVRVVMS